MPESFKEIARDDFEKVLNHAESAIVFTQLARGAFHQAANYLATINSDLLMLEMFAQTSRTAEMITCIHQTKSTLRLVTELVTRIMKRGGEPTLRECSLVPEVVRPAIDYIKRKIEGQNIHVSHSLGNREFIALVDSELAKEIMINLLNNAIWAVRQNKHTTKKEVSIAVREEPNESLVRIVIRDSGIGIERSMFPKLFQPFFTTREGGTGLGLFSSLVLAKRFGGDLQIARSLPGKGTTVMFSLPLAKSH